MTDFIVIDPCDRITDLDCQVLRVESKIGNIYRQRADWRQCYGFTNGADGRTAEIIKVINRRNVSNSVARGRSRQSRKTNTSASDTENYGTCDASQDIDRHDKISFSEICLKVFSQLCAWIRITKFKLN